MIPTRWQTLEPLLDQALDADTALRADLLRELQESEPELAQALEGLLSKHRRAQASEFLLGADLPGLFGAPSPGQQFGAYTLEHLLGEGGMGSVWLAHRHDGRYEGQVAIKLLSRGLFSPMVADRFRREGQILARLDHPHIARLLDAGVSPHGQPYLVLEHVRGLRVDEYADRHRLDVETRLRLFLELLDAVSHAHLQLVVHRDIKPSNVMVTDQGQVKLLDFGVAKLLEDEDSSRPGLTQQAGGLLSPGFAAPEQVRGEPTLPTADVFALGVLLSILLTGRHPFLQPGDSTADALLATLERPMARLCAVLPDPASAQARDSTPLALCKRCRGDLDTLVAKALARDPAMRFSSAAEFAADLRRHLSNEPILAHPPSMAYRLGKFAQRQRLPLGVGLLGLSVACVLAFNAWQQQQAAALSQARAQSVDGLVASLFEGMSPSLASSKTFQARELLDRSRQFLDETAGMDPATRRQALLRMASLYVDIAAYEQARSLYQGELDEARAAREAVAEARALWEVANVNLKLDAVAEARRSLEDLARLIRMGQVDPAAWTWRLQMLEGEASMQAGDMAGAEARLQQAARGVERSPSPTELALRARLRWSEGQVARLLGKLPQAAEHFEKAAQLQRQRGPAGTLDHLSVQVEFAALENARGRFQAALSILSPTQAELSARLPAQSYLVARAAGQLAYAHLRTGHFEQARNWAANMRRAADPQAQRIDRYPDLIDALVTMHSGSVAEAEPVLRAQLNNMLRDESGTTVLTEPLRRTHAEALLRLNRSAEARAELKETIDNQTRLTHAQHSSVAISRVLWGCVLARQGELVDARRTWQQASEVLLGTLGPQHPYALAATAYLMLADPSYDSEALPRRTLIDRLRAELGWQSGAAELARRLSTPTPVADWASLPVVL